MVGQPRPEEQENTLTQVSFPECSDLYNGNESHTQSPSQTRHQSPLRARVSQQEASPFRPNSNSVTHDGPDKAMGDGRQCETSSGALTNHPGSFAGPTVGEKEACLEVPPGTARLGRNLHKPLARIVTCSGATNRAETNRRVRYSPQIHSKSRRHSLRRFESTQRQVSLQ